MAASQPRRRDRDGDEDYPCRASTFRSSGAEADRRRIPVASPTDVNRRRRSRASPLNPNRRSGRDTSHPEGAEDNRYSMPSGYADYHPPRHSMASDGGEDGDRRRRRSRVSDDEREDGSLPMRAGVSDDKRYDGRGKRCRRSSRSERELCPDDRCRRVESSRRPDDCASPVDQRQSWDALEKNMNGLINKANASNIKDIVSELFAQNLVRGQGLFCQSCIRSQTAAPQFTDVFAALVAVVNTKFPDICHLLLVRVVLQLKRALKRQNMAQLLAASKFIAHLVNQMVVHELLALELLKVIIVNSTDDNVEVAVGFVKECGAMLQLLSPQQLQAIFERFRCLLHEGGIDKRVQFLIEDLFTIRKENFKGYPSISPELDLVEQANKCIHEIYLEDELDPKTNLSKIFFRTNPNYIEDEKAYENIKKTILGSNSSEDEERMEISGKDETSLLDKRHLYLAVMASAHFEEAGLMKIEVRPGQEMELCATILDCCSRERAYLRYFGLLAQRYCMMKRVYQENFKKCFVQRYLTAGRLEINELRNVAKFFAHLLETDTLPWHVLACIRLDGEETSSTRIFVKFIFQELLERLGIQRLTERLNGPNMQGFFESVFPKDHPNNMRFAIKFFTAHGLGVITERLLEKMTPLTIIHRQPASSG